MPKRGMSAVIVTLLLVMLSIVLIGIVYAVISNIVKSGTQQTTFQFGTLFMDLSLSKVSVDSATGDVSVVVKRNSGGDSSLNLSGVAFVFSDGVNSITVKKTADISVLGSRTFTFTPSELKGIAGVKEVQIAPIINSNGKDQIGREVDSSSSNYYISCYNILEAGASSGSGVYTIDPDGPGALQPIKVYCDMTTDGGGWTLVLLNSPYSTPPKPNWDAVVNDNNIKGTFGSDLTAFDQFLGVKYWNDIGNKIRVEVGSSPTSISHDATYNFSLDVANNYELSMSNENIITGTTEPGIYTYHAANHYQLTTYDADHDAFTGNCATQYSNTAWWYGACWSGSFWGGGDSDGYSNNPYWTGSGSDHYPWGAIWIK